MKKIIREDKENGITQITIADERWYLKENPKTLEKEYVPSVTWKAGFYPKGIAFYKWLANKSWDEAEALKSATGNKGSKVHLAIADLLDGKEVPMEAQYLNQTTEQMEGLTLEEYDCLMSFINWHKLWKPQMIAREFVVFSKKHNYAGTADFLFKSPDGKTWLTDFKTGQNIWPEHELQISAYKHSDEMLLHKDLNIGILQLGYWRNKNKWKFTEIKDKFPLFLAASQIWEEECAKISPKRRDYPVVLTLKEA